MPGADRRHAMKDLIAAGVTAETISRWETGHREEERRRLTLEAMADVDAGHVIDHQAVQAWARSLGTRKSRPPSRR
jgi:predicted transcriptional regulator